MKTVQWIYPEAEILHGIKRNRGDEFEITDEHAEQLIYQGRVKILKKKENIEEEKENKDKRRQ